MRGEALGRQVPRGSTAEPWGLSGLCLVQVVGSSASSARLKGRELPQNKLCHRLKGWGTKAVAKHPPAAGSVTDSEVPAGDFDQGLAVLYCTHLLAARH